MPEALDTLGIISGAHSLPLLLARQARAMGVRRLIGIGFEDQSNHDLEPLVDKMIWMKLGQLSKLIDTFRENGVRHCVMVGKIAPKSFFDVRPDLRTIGAVLKLKEKNAHTLFGALADELKKDGIELIEATPWLRNYLKREKALQANAKADERRCVPGAGCLTVCGLRDGHAQMGQFCIATRLADALHGDVKKGLFFRGSEPLPFGAAIRPVAELFEHLLGPAAAPA